MPNVLQRLAIVGSAAPARLVGVGTSLGINAPYIAAVNGLDRVTGGAVRELLPPGLKATGSTGHEYVAEVAKAHARAAAQDWKFITGSADSPGVTFPIF